VLVSSIIIAVMKNFELTSLLAYFRQQFQSGVPADGDFGVNTGVEGFQTGPFGTSLLTKLVRSVAEHDTLVVSN
jgi:hypothetical protein